MLQTQNSTTNTHIQAEYCVSARVTSLKNDTVTLAMSLDAMLMIQHDRSLFADGAPVCIGVPSDASDSVAAASGMRGQIKLVSRLSIDCFHVHVVIEAVDGMASLQSVQGTDVRVTRVSIDADSFPT